MIYDNTAGREKSYRKILVVIVSFPVQTVKKTYTYIMYYFDYYYKKM